MSELYDTDPALWADGQIRALQRLAELHPEIAAELDVPHLVEELDDMKKSVARELTSRLAVILAHLAKWRWQPGRRTVSWTNTLGEQRDQVDILLNENPSFRPRIPEHLRKAWPYGRKRAHRETGLALDVFPLDCPFTVDQALADGWLPD
jgi:hypothetical protein